jgi:hypothetical protein
MATISRRARKTTPAAAADATPDTATPDTATPDTVTPATPDTVTDATPDTTEAADDATGTDATEAADKAAGADDTEAGQESPGTDTPADAPVSGAPTSGGPTGNGADHLKIAMVAGVLAARTHGVTASVIVDESGLRAAIVGRVLAAMEAAGAAVRKPSATPGAADLWVRGEADLTAVTIVVAPTTHTCTCGHVHKVPAPTVATTRGATIAGRNGDGQAALGKGVLRDMVLAFGRRHMGHELTPAPVKAPADEKAPEADQGTTGEAAPATHATGTADK